MYEARGNYVILVHGQAGQSFIVGDQAGWTFNVAGWEKGKNFKEGDVLIFNYERGVHNVAVVDKTNYDSCTVSKGAEIHGTCADEIALNKGANYFISGDCQRGMKIAPIATLLNAEITL